MKKIYGIVRRKMKEVIKTNHLYTFHFISLLSRCFYFTSFLSTFFVQLHHMVIQINDRLRC